MFVTARGVKNYLRTKRLVVTVVTEGPNQILAFRGTWYMRVVGEYVKTHITRGLLFTRVFIYIVKLYILSANLWSVYIYQFLGLTMGRKERGEVLRWSRGRWHQGVQGVESTLRLVIVVLACGDLRAPDRESSGEGRWVGRVFGRYHVQPPPQPSKVRDLFFHTKFKRVRLL